MCARLPNDRFESESNENSSFTLYSLVALYVCFHHHHQQHQHIRRSHTNTHTLQYSTNTMEKRIYTNRSEHQGKCHQQCYTKRMDYIAMFRHQPVAMTLCTCSCCCMLLYGSHYDVNFVSAFFDERELISRIFGVKVSIAAQSKLYGSIKYKRIQNRIRSCL